MRFTVSILIAMAAISLSTTSAVGKIGQIPLAQQVANADFVGIYRAI